MTSVLEIDEQDHTATRFDGGWEAYRHERAAARRLAEEAFATRQGATRWPSGAAASGRGPASVARAPSGPTTTTEREAGPHRQRRGRAGDARRTERAMERLTPVQKPWEGWELRLAIADAGRSGTVVAALTGVVVEQGGFRLGPVDLEVDRGDRVALVGPNRAARPRCCRRCWAGWSR